MFCPSRVPASSCCTPTVATTDKDGREVFGGALYATEDAAEPALAASLGCDVPTAVTDLHDGDTVLDFGSGASGDVPISARRVAPTGRAIGILEDPPTRQRLRRRDDLQLRHQPRQRQTVLREAARVLHPAGRFAVSDVIADDDMADATRADIAQWTGCIGALTQHEFEDALAAAGLVDITETHRVHEHAAATVDQARLKVVLGSAAPRYLTVAETRARRASRAKRCTARSSAAS